MWTHWIIRSSNFTDAPSDCVVLPELFTLPSITSCRKNRGTSLKGSPMSQSTSNANVNSRAASAVHYNDGAEMLG